MTKLKNTKAIKKILQNQAKVIKVTYNSLAQIIRHPNRQPTPKQLHRFSKTLEYMGDVHEGFLLSQRVSAQMQSEDLQQLGKHVLLDWQWVETMNLSILPDNEVKAIDNQLIAYQHAVMTLGTIPNLPPEAITFPQPHSSYTDISIPAVSSQMLERIEEIEQVIYQAGIMRLNQIEVGLVRRTYAFFEASVWLVNHYPPSLLAE